MNVLEHMHFDLLKNALLFICFRHKTTRLIAEIDDFHEVAVKPKVIVLNEDPLTLLVRNALYRILPTFSLDFVLILYLPKLFNISNRA